jgi:hypothetical protein
VDLDTGEDACEYVPFRAERGGRILGGQAPLTLRGAPLRRDRWTFTSHAGWQIAVEIADKRRSDPWPLFLFDVSTALVRVPAQIRRWRRAYRTMSEAKGDQVSSVLSGPEVESQNPKPRSLFEVHLDTQPSLGISPDPSMELAFGCWILVEWRSMNLPTGGG